MAHAERLRRPAAATGRARLADQGPQHRGMRLRSRLGLSVRGTSRSWQLRGNDRRGGGGGQLRRHVARRHPVRGRDHLPEAISEGNGQMAIFVDDRATQTQAEAIATILLRRAGGIPFEAWPHGQLTRWPGARANRDAGERRKASFRIPGVLELAQTPIRNPVSGEERRSRSSIRRVASSGTSATSPCRRRCRASTAPFGSGTRADLRATPRDLDRPELTTGRDRESRSQESPTAAVLGRVGLAQPVPRWASGGGT